MEYILYCDESSSNGAFYGDFFGGCLVSGVHIHEVTEALEQKKSNLNLFGEIKWTKVTANYVEKHEEIIDLFFDFIKQGKIKVRIMFRDIRDIPSRPFTYEADDKYFKLYYQILILAYQQVHTGMIIRRGNCHIHIGNLNRRKKHPTLPTTDPT